MTESTNPDHYIFGANILENLTTGMYNDSKIIYREYIQNACDQIDKAITGGLLNQEEGLIEIWLDPQKRNIEIKDNATGICAADFQHTLGDIAYSDKRLGEDKGFRGIGRLCGLAYCKKLIFSTTAKGEDVISYMRCDASVMREMIRDNEQGKKHTASEVLHAIYTFDKEQTDKIDDHWFKVEMIDIIKENTDLLDSDRVKKYLSFVAPVPYQNTFCFRNEIYEHAKNLGQHIDEYHILLDGEPIFKKYKTHFKTSKGDDEIFKLEYKEIYDPHDNLLAWLWYGVSCFKATLLKECEMRGLRLRKENIQIGNDDTLQKLFREDRGNHYFIGEVFAIAKDLIPNSQRDYFNENSTRSDFEKELRCFFDDLHDIYYKTSSIHSDLRKIENYQTKREEFEQKKRNNAFIDKNHFNHEEDDVKKSLAIAQKAQQDIEKKKQKSGTPENSVIRYIIERLEKERKPEDNKLDLETEKTEEVVSPRVSKLSTYSKRERKLISKIYSIIYSATDKETAEKIIDKIEAGLQ